MSSLKLVVKVTRIEQCLIVAVSTWLIALLSNGPLWFNDCKVAAAACMFFSCLGASVLHYGRRHDVYRKKWYDLVIINHPRLLVAAGSLSFLVSLVIAWVYLPTPCFWVALGNFIVILVYANCLDQYWPVKNIVIAFVCVSPIVMGWYSGHRLHPIVPYLLIGAYGIYFVREVLKDVCDIDANNGKRLTMVMSLGNRTSLRIAGVLLLASVVVLTLGLRVLPISMTVSWMFALAAYGVAMAWLLLISNKLIRGWPIAHYYKFIDFGTVSLMASMLAVRVSY